MPRKPKLPKPSAEILAPISADILDQIVRDGPLTAADVEIATRRFKKALIERALGAELSHHLGYSRGTAKPEVTTNHRNGTSGKTVLTDDGPVPIEVPRDREGTFEPQLIGKHERRSRASTTRSRAYASWARPRLGRPKRCKAATSADLIVR